MTTTIVATSTEYIWVPVRSDNPISGAVELTSYPVDIAFLSGTGDPAAGDWKTAAWETTPKTINGLVYYLARLKIGPSGAVTLTTNTTYVTFVRLTVGGDTPVVQGGLVRVV